MVNQNNHTENIVCLFHVLKKTNSSSIKAIELITSLCHIMSSVEINPSDVIRLVEQYLKENSLFKTLKALQDETSVNLNTVDSVETFVNDINSGHWDVVLKTVKLLKLPDNKLIDLYEHIAIELLELRENRAAKWLIQKAEPLLKLKQTLPDRYDHLQNLSRRESFDYYDAYADGSNREKRRNFIANSLKKEVTVVPPQRLLSLVGDALKWQKHEGLLPPGTSIDIFTGKATMIPDEEETHPNILHRHCVKPIRNMGDSDIDQIFIACADFSPDGNYLVVGYSTGLIEVRNSTTGRIANDLKYQRERNYIVTPSKTMASSVCFSTTNELMAIGDMKGDICVWKLETGELIKKITSAHTKGVSCLLFDKDVTEILSGSQDRTAKLHGMRGNQTIRDFRGHQSLVTAVAFSRDYNVVITGSFDCTVKIWSRKTTEKIQEFKFESGAKVHNVIPMPQFKKETFMIGTQTRFIQLIDIDCKEVTKLSDDKETEQTADKSKLNYFYALCSSPKGKWIYAVDSKTIQCFNYSSGKVVKSLNVHEEDTNEVIGVIHHPKRNLLATYDIQGNLKLWRP